MVKFLINLESSISQGEFAIYLVTWKNRLSFSPTPKKKKHYLTYDLQKSLISAYLTLKTYFKLDPTGLSKGFFWNCCWTSSPESHGCSTIQDPFWKGTSSAQLIGHLLCEKNDTDCIELCQGHTQSPLTEPLKGQRIIIRAGKIDCYPFQHLMSSTEWVFFQKCHGMGSPRAQEACSCLPLDNEKLIFKG